MRRVGEVTGKSGELLEITFCRPADCGKCHACVGGQKQTTLRLKGAAEIGDAAVVDMPTSTVMKASLIAYAIPLAGLLLGAVLGNVLAHGSDLGVAVGGLVGLALTACPVFLTEKKRRSQPGWQPELVQILPREEGGAAAIKEEE